LSVIVTVVFTAPFGSTIIHMPPSSLNLNVDHLKIIQSLEENLSLEAGSHSGAKKFRVFSNPVGIVDKMMKSSEL
jgi:hypothetical protein